MCIVSEPDTGTGSSRVSRNAWCTTEKKCRFEGGTFSPGPSRWWWYYWCRCRCRCSRYLSRCSVITSRLLLSVSEGKRTWTSWHASGQVPGGYCQAVGTACCGTPYQLDRYLPLATYTWLYRMIYTHSRTQYFCDTDFVCTGQSTEHRGCAFCLHAHVPTVSIHGQSWQQQLKGGSGGKSQSQTGAPGQAQPLTFLEPRLLQRTNASQGRSQRQRRVDRQHRALVDSSPEG